MRASRLVSMLLLLQTRGRLTARQLADTLEVSVRTVYRDVESLGAAGVPVYGEPGHDGGYQLLDGYRTQLTGFTEGEAESLFLTGLPGAAADLGLGATVTAAQLKLLAALPAELRDRAGRVAERFHLDAPSWYREADATPYLSTVAAAVWRQRALRMRYLRWAAPQEVTRVVAPHGLVLKAGRWYLVARHPADHGDALRTYRVSRLLSAELLDEPFERLPGFVLADHWRGSTSAGTGPTPRCGSPPTCSPGSTSCSNRPWWRPPSAAPASRTRSAGGWSPCPSSRPCRRCRSCCGWARTPRCWPPPSCART